MIYGENRLSGSVQWSYAKLGAIHLKAIGGEGYFKWCTKDDYDSVKLKPPQASHFYRFPLQMDSAPGIE